ncbi:hypothetical protein Btru_046204 [Bulinus truncatus]|nr:hypothetical protein Btru_046204 [Bulinus truncatus]
MATNISVSQTPASSAVLAPRYDGLMSSETSSVTILSLNIVNLILCLCGLATNAVNVLVFTRAGPGINATSASFLALSVSDFLFLLLMFMFQILRVLNKTLPMPGVPLSFVGIVLIAYWHFAYNASVLITVYTAVQKACCVAIPLKFKNVFTVRRTVVIIALIALGLLAFYLPMMSTVSITQTTSRGTNVSTYSLTYAPKSVSSTFDLTLQNILPSVTLVAVMVCLLVLVVKLKEASAFRSTMNASGDDQKSSSKSKDVGSSSSSAFSARELKVVQAVTAVSAMFVACNLPPILVTYATFVEPEFNDFRYYGNLYAAVGSARLTLQILCATVNICVYYHFNSGYRSTLRAAACGAKKGIEE